MPVSSDNESGIVVLAPENIVRFNRVIGGTAGISVTHVDSTSLKTPNVYRNKIYHNTLTGNLLHGISVRGFNIPGGDFSENSFVNNAIVDNRSETTTVAISWGPSVQVLINRQMPLDLQGTEFRNNLVLNESAGAGPEAVVHVVARSPTWCNTLADVETDTTHCAGPAGTWSGNRDSGTLKDAGDFLTTAVWCSGSTIRVEDARFFTEGIAGAVAGDSIQFEVTPPPNTPATYPITAIDLATNTLTVTGTPTCTNGQGVSLKFADSAPDIGSELNR